MPVHNALPHLDQAVESILGQTFPDFEFVILDDASTDGSSERLLDWARKDKRIRLLKSKTNLGPTESSNKVARAATASLVARMDADDISLPERLAEQVQLLRDHPDVGVVASVCEMIDLRGRKLRDPEVWRLSRRSVFVPFAHGAMMYRRAIFDEVGGYRQECEYWEDQDLIVRMAATSKVAVIPRPLYRIRQSSTSTRVTCAPERLEHALDKAYRAADQLEQGKDYKGLFDGSEHASHKLDPRVFVALGSVRLWAGGRPRLLLRLLKRGRMSLNLRTLTALGWTAWASTSPRSLRAFLLMLLAARNRFAPKPAFTDGALRWQPRTGGGIVTEDELML